MAIQSSVMPEGIGDMIETIFCPYCRPFPKVIENARARLENPSTTRITNLAHFTASAVITNPSSNEHK